MLTARQVRDRLNVSRPTLERLIKTGQIAAVRIGNRGDFRISEEALDDYIERNRAVPEAQAESR